MLILAQLFLTFAFISCFGFGGGYGFLPLIQQQIIDAHGWMTINEFTDMIAIAESTPGPIAINTATYVGFKMAGIPGAFLATMGLVLPTFFLILLLSALFLKHKEKPLIKNAFLGMAPVIAAMITGTALKMGLSNINSLLQLSAALIVLILAAKSKIHPAFLLLGMGIIGLFIPF